MARLSLVRRDQGLRGPELAAGCFCQFRLPAPAVGPFPAGRLLPFRQPPGSFAAMSNLSRGRDESLYFIPLGSGRCKKRPSSLTARRMAGLLNQEAEREFAPLLPRLRKACSDLAHSCFCLCSSLAF